MPSRLAFVRSENQLRPALAVPAIAADRREMGKRVGKDAELPCIGVSTWNCPISYSSSTTRLKPAGRFPSAIPLPNASQ